MTTATKQQVLDLATTCTDNGRVDVIKLATKLGINVYAVESEDQNYNAEIKFDKDSDQFNIFVNENHPETRRRFSIAHEISHYVLDEAELRQKGSLDRSSIYVDEAHKDREQSADKLAAEILMPASKVEKYLKERDLNKYDFTPQSITQIADYFHVSKAMAITRLRNMDYPIPYLTFA